ncbi:MAG: class I SAM-dependent methyltransferase [Filifactoraceae bacterium]
MLLIADKWKDYKIIDAGNGEKLEKWGSIVLRRPDPQAIWNTEYSSKFWKSNDGHYYRSSQGGGKWELGKNIPDLWQISYGDLIFNIKPTGFKHTGLFPEQAANWDWIQEKIISAKRPIKVLNLFAYTGGATCAASKAGAAEVCHVDASKGMVSWAKDNAKSSGLEDNKIRYIVDDVFKFIEREIRRGNKYDAIIMDPPSYGRGPKGEIWKIEEELFKLLELTKRIISDNPLFILINSYTTGFSNIALRNMMILRFKNLNGKITSGEIALPIEDQNLILPCGIFGRWESC